MCVYLYGGICFWRRTPVLPFRNHLLPEALHLEVGPCKIPHPIRMSAGDVIVLVFFRQLYCWNFMSVAFLLYVED